MTWPDDRWWQPQMVAVADRTRLAIRIHHGAGRPVVLVHGLASNALLWRDVAEGLAAADHSVAAVDLRGHGRSDRPGAGYSTTHAAVDLDDAVRVLGWESQGPIVAGQSWGGNVAARVVARASHWRGLLCVDGGWIDLSRRFDRFDDCWHALTPPGFGNATPEEVIAMLRVHLQGWPTHALEAVVGNLEPVQAGVRNRLALDHHRAIVHSLWSDPPFDDLSAVSAPAHLMVAGRGAGDDVEGARQLLADATISWHPEAHHDIHLQQPEAVLNQLFALLRRVQGSKST